MNTLINKFKWIAGGLVVTLLAGAPAVADDTELLLVRPDGIKPKPNVVFIVDSSGSMNTTQNTREVYNATNPYPLPADNACDPNRLYWTEVNIVPSCDPANTRFIQKDAYLCADSVQQLAGIGRYTGVHGQYRDGASGFFSFFLGVDAQRWQKIQSGNATDKVECGNDFGVHGDGSAGEVFPQKGGDVAMFTTDDDEAISWGSWPTSQVVTVWDGNYLNYLRDPTFVDKPRINIVKEVSEAVLNSIGDVNVAIMRFNGNDGGAVISAMQDLDANRADIIQTISNINAGGNTPLSETLYEAALYWRGMAARYGNGLAMTDADALKATGPDIYQEPSFDSCAKNFNIVLTDGVPTEDTDTPTLVDSLPNWFGTVGYAGCQGTEMGHCLDDLAAYMKDGDISATEPEEQEVITHTIGFAIDLDILEDTAQRGGGDYFQADNVESLTLTLLDITSQITEENLSFAAPAVAVNSFNRTQNFNDLYMTTFRPSEETRWPGNLKKYEIRNNVIVDKFGEPAIEDGFFKQGITSFWSSEQDNDDPAIGGAVENLPAPDVRRLFTDISSGNLTDDNNRLHPDNTDAFDAADFGLTGSADEPSIEDLIRWTRGEDTLDFDSDPSTNIRPKRMGDSLHAQPAAVVYGGSEDNPDVVVFSATNDGKIHAIDADTGEELWAFMPREHLPNLVRLFFNPESTFKLYGIDGDIVPVVGDRDGDGIIEPGQDEFVHIIFGMRRGGTAFYSLDVTNRNAPTVNWRVDATAFGQSWSRPTIARVDTGNRSDFSTENDEQAVVIIGGGYDTVHDTLAHPTSFDASGAGVYMLDLHTGTPIWRAGPDGPANLTLDPDVRPGLSRSIVSQIRVIDINGDGFADRMYAADLGGQILRFDIFSGNSPDGIGEDAFVTGGVIAQLGAEGLGSASDADTRRFFTAPDVSLFIDPVVNRRFVAISIGSGYRPHPLDNTPEEKFFSVRDADVFSQLTQDEYNGYQIVRTGDLVEVSGSVGVAIGNNKRGWMLTLPPTQKVMSTSVTFDNEVFFIGFAPDLPGASVCKAGIGNNWLYRVSVVNGDPVINNMDTVTDATADAARVKKLDQGGIAPSPRFLFPSPDADCTGDECSPPPIGCIGVECFDPGFQNFPVRTLWTQDGIQ